MKKARFELSSPSNSIHLVSKRRLEESLSEGVESDATRSLPSGIPQYGILFGADPMTVIEEFRDSHERKPVAMVNQAAVLRELFELLEDYSPVWYTEETHERAVAALKLAMR